MSKAEFGKVKWRQYAVNLDREKTGNVLPTSQGPVVFTKDTKALDNPELAAELKEKHPRYIRTVAREAPIESGRFSMVMPELPWKRRNRMGRLEREEEERERAGDQTLTE
jgi:hypothetical protein